MKQVYRHEPRSLGDRCGLLHEVRELDVHVCASCLKLPLDFFEDLLKLFHGDFSPELIENLDKPAHVGSLEFVGKVHKQVEYPYGVLQSLAAIFYRDRIAESFHPNFVDGNLARVRQSLDVRNGQWIHGHSPGHGATDSFGSNIPDIAQPRKVTGGVAFPMPTDII